MILGVLRSTPLMRFFTDARKQVERDNALLEEQKTITEIHAKKANWYFYEKNHITPLVTDLVVGDLERGSEE